MLLYGLTGDLEDGVHLLPRNGRKVGKKVVEPVSRLKAIEQGSDRHARTGEARSS